MSIPKQERLTLKWGTVKGWNNLSDKSLSSLQKWADGGVTLGAAQQWNTDQQIRDLCEAIDQIAGTGGEFWNDWEGISMTADDAKEYVKGYRK